MRQDQMEKGGRRRGKGPAHTRTHAHVCTHTHAHACMQTCTCVRTRTLPVHRDVESDSTQAHTHARAHTCTRRHAHAHFQSTGMWEATVSHHWSGEASEHKGSEPGDQKSRQKQGCPRTLRKGPRKDTHSDDDTSAKQDVTGDQAAATRPRGGGRGGRGAATGPDHTFLSQGGFPDHKGPGRQSRSQWRWEPRHGRGARQCSEGG